MSPKLKEVTLKVDWLAETNRLVFVAAVRYCPFDMQTKMHVDCKHIDSDQLNEFTQTATMQMLTGRSVNGELSDLMLSMIKSSPWGVFVACQERPGLQVRSALLLPRKQFADDGDGLIGDWPNPVSIKGDFLASLHIMSDHNVTKLDQGRPIEQEEEMAG